MGLCVVVFFYFSSLAITFDFIGPSHGHRYCLMLAIRHRLLSCVFLTLNPQNRSTRAIHGAMNVMIWTLISNRPLWPAVSGPHPYVHCGLLRLYHFAVVVVVVVVVVVCYSPTRGPFATSLCAFLLTGVPVPIAGACWPA
jgi:hypothetical protein